MNHIFPSFVQSFLSFFGGSSDVNLLVSFHQISFPRGNKRRKFPSMTINDNGAIKMLPNKRTTNYKRTRILILFFHVLKFAAPPPFATRSDLRSLGSVRINHMRDLPCIAPRITRSMWLVAAMETPERLPLARARALRRANHENK